MSAMRHLLNSLLYITDERAFGSAKRRITDIMLQVNRAQGETVSESLLCAYLTLASSSIAMTELKTAGLCHGLDRFRIAPTFGDGSNNGSNRSMCCNPTSAKYR
jgi:hypothetical protein